MANNKQKLKKNVSKYINNLKMIKHNTLNS